MLAGNLLEFPSGPVPLNSPFYIYRSPIEELACREICQSGSVVRIKSPKQTGKSSLLAKLIAYAVAQNYHTVHLDFHQADDEIFTSFDKFLRWFCANVTRQLKMQPRLKDYWDEDIGSKVSCTLYLQGYLLAQVNNPVILALNELNRVFEYPKIAQEFLPLLRSWHEEAKQDEILQKLRLVVVHSTEIYIPLNLNQSPFNVGLPLKLPDFTLAQVHELATRHGLKWNNRETKQLMGIVGGHPYLVRLGLYHISRGDLTLKQLIKEASTQGGVYNSHLRSYITLLQNHWELSNALCEVVKADRGVSLEPLLAYRLESMGLVKLEGNLAVPRCELYRQYFREQNWSQETTGEQIVTLQKQNHELLRLSNLDDMTQLANRRYFEAYLEEEWHRLSLKTAPLSLILLDIDHFKIYNDSRGHQAGDSCLQQLANVIRKIANRPTDLVARYGGEEFGLILPSTEAFTAFYMAERIREEVKNLGFSHDVSKVGGLPAPVITISLGIACQIPSFNSSPGELLLAADRALYQSKRDGRDRITVSDTFNYGLLES